ncbi:MAG: acyltransferase, partial [Lachnospiraceae bacterium]|nr:acyltransferase [Lachnospiraceae bacterium]
MDNKTITVEKNEKNSNMDIFRALSLLLVFFYHCWVCLGAYQIKIPIINYLILLGGELGVTAFFMLSGYGIFSSLDRTDKTISFKDFMVKRLKRVAPQYYLNLFVVLVFTSSAVYMGKEYIANILAHIFFVHNFKPEYSGAINGVLWTMAVIFQFYIIAIPLFKLIKKAGVPIVLLSVPVTIVIKMSVFKLIAAVPEYNGNFGAYGFWAGRQLITALDNFVLGMGVAYISKKKKWRGNALPVCMIITGLTLLYGVMLYGIKNGIHTNNISGYTWHSMVAVALGIVMYGFAFLKYKYFIISKLLKWIAKYEYGIYLWHLVII